MWQLALGAGVGAINSFFGNQDQNRQRRKAAQSFNANIDKAQAKNQQAMTTGIGNASAQQSNLISRSAMNNRSEAQLGAFSNMYSQSSNNANQIYQNGMDMNAKLDMQRQNENIGENDNWLQSTLAGGMQGLGTASSIMNFFSSQKAADQASQLANLNIKGAQQNLDLGQLQIDLFGKQNNGDNNLPTQEYEAPKIGVFNSFNNIKRNNTHNFSIPGTGDIDNNYNFFGGFSSSFRGNDPYRDFDEYGRRK